MRHLQLHQSRCVPSDKQCADKAKCLRYTSPYDGPVRAVIDYSEHIDGDETRCPVFESQDEES